MKFLVINVLMAVVVLALTCWLVYETDRLYGSNGAIFSLLYLTGGIYVVVKVIPWSGKD